MQLIRSRIVYTAAIQPSGTSIQFQDEGSDLGNNQADTVDFVGAGVTATRVDDKITVTIPIGQSEVDAAQDAAEAYADSLVIGLWDDRGNFDASVNAYPSSGGSGTAGAILKGDIWTTSVAGVLGGVPVATRQTVRALIDAPAQTAVNWAIGLANTDIDDSITDGVTGRAPSQNSVFDALALKEDSLGYIPLNPANNLSDVSDAATAIQNIGGMEKTATVNTQTGTNYTLALSDFNVNTVIYMNRATGQTLTVPLNSTVAIPVGRTVFIRTINTGQTTVTPEGGVTITAAGGSMLSPTQYTLWALTKDGTNTWKLDNGGLSLGSANQVRAISNDGTSEEYKTVSNGLTSASGTFKLGGAFTADTNLSGAFSLGIGATPSAKFHVVGLGTTTGELLRLANNTPTTRLSILDNGSSVQTSSVSGAAVTAHSYTATLTSTANNQTQTAYDFAYTPATGGFTGQSVVPFRIRSTTSSPDFYNITDGIHIFSGSQFTFLNSTGTSILRNTAAAISLRGGSSTSTRGVQFSHTSPAAINNLAVFNFTDRIYTSTSSVITRTNIGTLYDYDVSITSSGVGGTLNHTAFSVAPSFAMSGSTLNLTGWNYNPSITATIGTHYAMLIQSGTVGIGTATPVTSALVEMVSTTKGLLLPRMTATQAEAISSPAEGLLIYSTNGTGSTITSKGWWGYDGAAWVKLN